MDDEPDDVSKPSSTQSATGEDVKNDSQNDESNEEWSPMTHEPDDVSKPSSTPAATGEDDKNDPQNGESNEECSPMKHEPDDVSKPSSTPAATWEDDKNDPQNGESNEESSPKTRRKKDLFLPENLQRMLADALTFKSRVSDLETIVKCGGNVNGVVQQGLLPLHYAVHAGNLDGIRFLLDKGAEIDAADEIGYRPVHLCARRGLYDSLKMLIDNGACVDVFADQQDIGSSDEYITIEPLSMALENNYEDCARLLLTHGARPDHHYFLGYEINIIPLENIECLKLLLQHGADPNVFSRCGLSPLMKSCRQRNIRSARVLVEKGADINLQPPDKFEQKTALHFAIESGSVGITSMLIRHRAMLTRPPNYAYSALHTAVIQDKPEFTELLLKWDARVDELTDQLATALQLACATPNLKYRHETIKVLLSHGANVNISSPFVSFSSPFLSPLTEYMRCETNHVTYDVIYELVINGGAIVNFQAASTSARFRDSHGILHCIQHLKTKPDIFHLLVSVSDIFDTDSISAYSSLSKQHKDILLEVGNRPRDLKTLVRLSLRRYLTNRFYFVVSNLSLPTMFKEFLLCSFSRDISEF